MKAPRVEPATDTVEDVRAKQAVATASVVASGVVAGLKLIVGALTSSLGLLAEGAHSLFDLISTLITVLVVRVAAITPDANHPYGHERAENLGALAGMALLAATALFIFYHSFETILELPVMIHSLPPSILRCAPKPSPGFTLPVKTLLFVRFTVV